MSKSISASQKDHNLNKLLGDFHVSLPRFEGLDELFASFKSKEFLILSEQQKYVKVHEQLCQRILAFPEPCFLLAAVVEYIDGVHKNKVLESYSFAHFELWLNQFSSYSKEENYRIRAKIAGRFVPRDAYQTLFPIGMDKVYPGSHYVTAHSSPDLDTTVASFWGWVDAFAARVAEGLHIWNLPGGPPSSQVEIGHLFDSMFGPSIFEHLIKTRTSLTLSGLELMTQKGFKRTAPDVSTLSIDHERSQNAIVVVDDSGHFLGDWRNIDVEGVRQLVMLLFSAMRWFQSHFQLGLAALFAKSALTKDDLISFSKDLFERSMSDSDFALHMTAKQRSYLDMYLQKIFGLKDGLSSSFKGFASAMQALSITSLSELMAHFTELNGSSLFDASGRIVDNRSACFDALSKVISTLDKAIEEVRLFADQLGQALKVKSEVFGFHPQVINYRAEVEEIRGKMGSYPYLTVTSSTKEGRMFPLGVIHAVDIHKPVLGTVTLRDFSNREETKVPPYFEVISIIDHHKTSLGTSTPPSVIISDQQSSNALVAEVAFEINAPYSVEGRSEGELEKQMHETQPSLYTSESKRIMQRLLQKQLALSTKGQYFVDPMREYVEYLHCLYAILDDTDLLSKVSVKDVQCVATLLNKMKSIASGKECEIIAFDDIPRDDQFLGACAKRIVQNVDMYSLYRKIYHLKEEGIEHNLRICVKGESSSIFVDTKLQNGCCRIGQTKMFAKNFPTYLSHSDQIRALWYAEAKQISTERKEVDLHIHMISTIPGAEEVFAGSEDKGYDHKDELWIYIPMQEQAIEHLKTFLSGFKQVGALQKGDLELEFIGANKEELDLIFKESFLPVPRVSKNESISLPVAVLRFAPGILNSRKAMISPYLPKI